MKSSKCLDCDTDDLESKLSSEQESVPGFKSMCSKGDMLHEKTSLVGFGPDMSKTWLYKNMSGSQSCNFRFRK